MTSQPLNERNSAEQTRLALVRAALDLFGRKGFEGSSTREIAALAEANIGSIAYHFGGKEGLRTACAEYIVSTLSAVSGQVLGSAPDPSDLSPAEAHALLKRMIETMLGFLVGQARSGDFVQFILRELANPSVALDAVYDRLFEPLHRRLCRIWQAATGEDADSDASKLAIFTLIGQIVYFRIGREAVQRRMDWTTITDAELKALTASVTANLDAMLAARTAPPTKPKES